MIHSAFDRPIAPNPDPGYRGGPREGPRGEKPGALNEGKGNGHGLKEKKAGFWFRGDTGSGWRQAKSKFFVGVVLTNSV